MIYKLKPILKHRLWGGNTIPSIFNVNTNDKIGEAWILSCINDDNSLLENGKSLKDLFLLDKNIIAKGFKGNFPILIKLIDAQNDLSIQVHPEIKTEFWHILNDKPSNLFLGFNKDVTNQQILDSLKFSTLPSLLNRVEVKKGDSYLIEPGTVHAINKSTFLIEIQQSADVTYRLYDYNRIDSNGKPRQLHIADSLACLNKNKLIVNKHNNDEHLVSTKFFNVYKYKINESKELNATDKSFNSIVVLSGKGQITLNDQTIDIKEYDSLFVPASSGKYTIKGNLTIILTTL